MAKTNLDDETTAALTLFNEYVAADRERTQREKRLKKAERAKDDAAALVKKLSKGGSSKERSEAEAAYRAAAENWQGLRDGKEPPADPEATENDEPELEDETDADAAIDDETEAEAEPEPEVKAVEESAADEEPESDTETGDEPAETEPADETEPDTAAATGSESTEAEPADETEPAEASESGEVKAESQDEADSSGKPAE